MVAINSWMFFGCRRGSLGVAVNAWRIFECLALACTMHDQILHDHKWDK